MGMESQFAANQLEINVHWFILLMFWTTSDDSAFSSVNAIRVCKI